jgi:serine/threonine protein kinase
MPLLVFVFYLILLIDLNSHLNAYLLHSEQNRHQFVPQGSDPKKRQLLQSIVQIFQISKKDLPFFDTNFNLNTIELIYPASLQNVKEMRRCVLGMKFKRMKNSAAIKLEFDSSVRARYDDQQRVIRCNNQGYLNGMPTERFIAILMRNNPNFIKFYAAYSKQLNNNGVKINTYVYERLPRTENLLAWTNQMKQNGQMTGQIEKRMKKYLRTIHESLSLLKTYGYAYTDYKPENVLIDQMNDKAYLIDLESVVSVKSRYVCLRTPGFTPPLYSKNGFFIDSDSLGPKAMNEFFYGNHVANPFDRLLSWSFCISIYSLLCLSANEIHTVQFQSRFGYWNNDYYQFMSYFGCPMSNQLSHHLVDFLNTCLTRKHEKVVFPLLIKHPWLSL